MNPAVLTGASIGTSIIGGIIGAFGAGAQGKSNQSLYNYRAAVSDVNRQIADANADYAIRVGERQAQHAGMEGRYRVGGVIAKTAASGIDINTGSKARVIESQQEVATHNQAVIRSDAAKRAYDFKVQATEASAQGTLFRAAASDSRRAGSTSALSSILGTASSVSSKWSDASTRGIFGPLLRDEG